MRHAIFGASTLLGRHLLQRLIEAGEEVMGYDADPDAAGATAVPVHRCDPDRDLDEPGKFFGIESIDVAYWCVKSPPFRAFPQGAGKLFATNVAGPVRVAEAAAAAGARAMIAVASGSLYQPSWRPIPETGDFQHFNPYAISAIAGEQALHVVHAGKPRMGVLCLRMFGLFGPGQAQGLVPGLIQRVRKGSGISLPPHPDEKDTDANGLQLSVTYVDDAVTCMVELGRLVHGGRVKDRVLNVAGPTPTSIRRLAELIGRATHLVPHYEVPLKARDGELIADTSRLRQLVNFEATSIEEAVQKTVEASPGDG